MSNSMAATRDQPFDHSMSFGDHLEELRKRVLLGLIVPLPLAVLFFVISDTLVKWLLLPVSYALRASGLPNQLQVLSPTEMIMLQMKLSIIAAFIAAAPWIVYQGWKFIEPGLFSHERRFVNFLWPLSALLTVAGVALMYFGILPLMLRVLIMFGATVQSGSVPPRLHDEVANLMAQHPVLRVMTEPPAAPKAGEVWLTWPGLELFAAVPDETGAVQVVDVPRSVVQQQYRLSEYINLVLMLMLAIVIAFQMPLVIALLGWMGLASPNWLRARRKYALMVCAVIAVIITPPDAISMLLMLVPLYALYELGILLLVIAPASAVAEGRVFSLRRFREPAAHNQREPMDQPRKPTQPEQSVPRSRRAIHPETPDVDDEENRP